MGTVQMCDNAIFRRGPYKGAETVGELMVIGKRVE